MLKCMDIINIISTPVQEQERLECSVNAKTPSMDIIPQPQDPEALNYRVGRFRVLY